MGWGVHFEGNSGDENYLVIGQRQKSGGGGSIALGGYAIR